jgi:hypothetical protein
MAPRHVRQKQRFTRSPVDKIMSSVGFLPVVELHDTQNETFNCAESKSSTLGGVGGESPRNVSASSQASSSRATGGMSKSTADGEDAEARLGGKMTKISPDDASSPADDDAERTVDDLDVARRGHR